MIKILETYYSNKTSSSINNNIQSIWDTLKDKQFNSNKQVINTDSYNLNTLSSIGRDNILSKQRLNGNHSMNNNSTSNNTNNSKLGFKSQLSSEAFKRVVLSG